MMTQQIANEVAKKVNASEYGVCITVHYVDGCEYFVIWKLEDKGIREHRLMCDKTDRARLQFHAEGFIENLKKNA